MRQKSPTSIASRAVFMRLELEGYLSPNLKKPRNVFVDQQLWHRQITAASTSPVDFGATLIVQLEVVAPIRRSDCERHSK